MLCPLWLDSKRNIIFPGILLSTPRAALRGFQKLFCRRMVFVPPGIRRPVNGRAIAAGRTAFEPKSSLGVLPNADGMAVKFFSAMQTPMFLFEIGPLAADAVRAKQIQFFVVRKRNVFGHATSMGLLVFPISFGERT